MGDRDGERAERELPVRALVAEALGRGDRAAQAEVDARRAGEQRAVRRVVGPPRDLAGPGLVGERVVDRPLDHRPQLPQERGVAGAEVVVPHAGGHVAGDVRVERRVLDVVADVVGVERRVRVLHAAEPLVRRARPPRGSRRGPAPSRLRPGSRVGVAARGPGDVAVGELGRGDRVDRLGQLRAGEDSFDTLHAAHPAALARTR